MSVQFTKNLPPMRKASTGDEKNISFQVIYLL